MPDFLRDLLLSIWFESDAYASSDQSYDLRLHKEKGLKPSKVGIVIMRGKTESLKSPEIDEIIDSFHTY